MLTKAFDMVIDDREDTGGELIAYASTFDREPDTAGDVVRRGAFADTLSKWAESGNSIPLLFGHRMDDPKMNLGRVTKAAEDERGLLIHAEFDPENETAQYVRKLVREGRLSKMSFAYDILDQGPVVLEDGRKANELRRLKLHEVSLVPVPANDHADVLDVKAAAGDTLENDEVVAELDSPETPAELDIDVAEPRLKAAGEEGDRTPDGGEDAPMERVAATLVMLAERIEQIGDALDALAQDIAMRLPVDEVASNEGIEAKGDEDVAGDDGDDNAEAPEGNAEVEVKAAETLSAMARYISIS